MAVFTLATTAALLNVMGVHPQDPKQSEFRADSGETAAFARQLQFVETEIYKTEYPANRARDFIPNPGGVPAWAETFVWRIWGWAGMAKIVANYADDLPAVDVMAAEKVQKIVPLGDSFGYSVDDLQAAVKLDIPLDTEKGEMARQAIENKIEYLAAFGDTATGLPGFVNMPNVPIMSAPTDLFGDWLNGSTTPEQILKDLHALARKVWSQTKGTFAADTLLLPPDHFAHISTTTYNTTTDATILDVFLKQSQWIRNVDQWEYLRTAGPGSTPMAICYKRDPKVVRIVIPLEFTMQPPQPVNLAFKVPCRARYGGVSWRQPLAAVYGVGI